MVLCYNSLTNTMMSKKVHPDVKVCFLTASELYYEEFREKEYHALDKDLFIRKPIDNEELLKEVNRIMT